jgi:hypothetical protein
MAGYDMIEDVIFLAIALFVEAVILPPALVTIATATLTSVNPAVTTMFTVLLPILAIVATVLLFVRAVRTAA